MSYQQKYLKYKEKYENLLQQSGGSDYKLKPGQIEISDPTILGQIENIDVLPMGHHTYYEGKNMYPSIEQTDNVRIETYPYYEALKARRDNSLTYTKYDNSEMTGPPIAVKKYKSDKDCAEDCSKTPFCQSFNVTKNGKKKNCVLHSNSSRFVPDNIHQNNDSIYYEKTFDF